MSSETLAKEDTLLRGVAEERTGNTVVKSRGSTNTLVVAPFTRQWATIMCEMADGVIAGSAIVKRIASHQQNPAMIGQVAEIVRSLKAAMVPA